MGNMLNLGGASFVNAEVKDNEFKKVIDGIQKYKLVSMHSDKSKALKANPDAPDDLIIMCFDVAEGPNEGVFAELTEKFPVAGWPWIKYIKKTFNITKEKSLEQLKRFVTHISNEPLNEKVGPAILSIVNATGQVDTDLITGTVVYADTEWETGDDGYQNLELKGYMPFIRSDEVDLTSVGKGKERVKPAQTGGGTAAPGDTGHEGEGWC